MVGEGSRAIWEAERSLEIGNAPWDGGGENVTFDGKKVCGKVGEEDGDGLAEGMYFEIPEFSASRIVLRSAGHGWTGAYSSSSGEWEAIESEGRRLSEAEAARTRS